MKQDNSLSGAIFSPYSKTKRIVVRSFRQVAVATVLIAGFLTGNAQVNMSGVNLGQLTNYLFVFTAGNVDANWQGASKGFAGDVAVNGLSAKERSSGNVPYAGTINTNDNSLDAFQRMINNNNSQASQMVNQGWLLTCLQNDLQSAFAQINGLPVTPGFAGVNSSSLNGLDRQNGVADVVVININSGFSVSSFINIKGDANDLFFLRWDSDQNFNNGYNGQVKFSSGGAIIPRGGLKPTNFIHVAGDIGSSGGGNNPPLPYPQGPRQNDGTGSLIANGSNFHGGGFFTGYWLTTGDPNTRQTSSLSNAIFVGGWYTSTTKFSMTSGTSGVHVSPPANLAGMVLGRGTGSTDTDLPVETPQFKIYPNPATAIVTIDLPVNWQNKHIKFEVFNLNGQVLNNLQTTIYKETVRLDLGKLPKGMYFVKLTCERESALQKIVKQ